LLDEQPPGNGVAALVATPSETRLQAQTCRVPGLAMTKMQNRWVDSFDRIVATWFRPSMR